MLTGQGTSSLTLLWGANGGNVQVRGTNSCGNSGTRTMNIAVTCRTADWEQSMSALHLNIYPNPASEKTIVTFNSLSESTYSLELCDLTGRAVYSAQGASVPGNNMVELPVASLAKGMYLLNFRNNHQSELKRLVIE
jgi:hypothetical protein